MEQDIRWEQRFSNYTKALHKLKQAIEYIKGEDEPIDDGELGYVLDETPMFKTFLTHREITTGVPSLPAGRHLT